MNIDVSPTLLKLNLVEYLNKLLSQSKPFFNTQFTSSITLSVLSENAVQNSYRYIYIFFFVIVVDLLTLFCVI